MKISNIIFCISVSKSSDRSRDSYILHDSRESTLHGGSKKRSEKKAAYDYSEIPKLSTDKCNRSLSRTIFKELRRDSIVDKVPSHTTDRKEFYSHEEKNKILEDNFSISNFSAITRNPEVGPETIKRTFSTAKKSNDSIDTELLNYTSSEQPSIAEQKALKISITPESCLQMRKIFGN